MYLDILAGNLIKQKIFIIIVFLKDYYKLLLTPQIKQLIENKNIFNQTTGLHASTLISSCHGYHLKILISFSVIFAIVTICQTGHCHMWQCRLPHVAILKSVNWTGQ